MKHENNNKKLCSQPHPMYNNASCENDEGHIGLHLTYHEGEMLRWGVPSHDEMYNVLRTK